MTIIKRFNTESITLKVNSVKTIDKLDRGGDKSATELKHDALYLLLVGPNPLRNEYGFDTENSWQQIEELRGQMTALINETKYLLRYNKAVISARAE